MMIKKLFALLLFTAIAYNYSFSQTENKNFLFCSISGVFLNTQLYKTEFNGTAKTEPYDYFKYAGSVGYRRYISKYISLEAELRYLGFVKEHGFGFSFTVDNGKTVRTGYDIDLLVKDYRLVLSLESNPQILSRLYFNLGAGAGINTFSNLNEYANKTTYGLDGNFVRVIKAPPLDTKNFYLSWYGGVGMYISKGDVNIKFGINSIHNTKVDMKYENLEIQNLETELYIKLDYGL